MNIFFLRVNGEPEGPPRFINKNLMKTTPDIQIKVLIILSTKVAPQDLEEKKTEEQKCNDRASLMQNTARVCNKSRSLAVVDMPDHRKSGFRHVTITSTPSVYRLLLPLVLRVPMRIVTH